jgi:hypothetical protein
VYAESSSIKQKRSKKMSLAIASIPANRHSMRKVGFGTGKEDTQRPPSLAVARLGGITGTTMMAKALKDSIESIEERKDLFPSEESQQIVAGAYLHLLNNLIKVQDEVGDDKKLKTLINM